MPLFDLLHPFASDSALYAVLGVGLLGLAVLLRRFEAKPVSFPLLAFALGFLAIKLPLGLTPPDPTAHEELIVRLTEVGVICSLFGVGLKLDRVPHLRTWSATWRLLLVCMPLTIAALGLLGWSLLGLAPAAAILLAASLAPTDPVLASAVQVGEPDSEVPLDEEARDDKSDPLAVVAEADPDDKPPEEREDEVRFALTSEAGLNDSLAFPFTYLAIRMQDAGGWGSDWGDWLAGWLAADVAYRLVVGLVVGVAVGWALGKILLRLPVETESQRMKVGVAALAATFLLYGVTELFAGYGFLAVFVGALAIRRLERTRQSHRSLHTFAEQTEQLMMTALLIAIGGAVAGGLLNPIVAPPDLAMIGFVLAAVLLARPLAGWISLIGESRLPRLDRAIVSAFGIRGIGCLFYLAYGVQHADFAADDAATMWVACIGVVTLSLALHGVTAAPVMRYRAARQTGRG